MRSTKFIVTSSILAGLLGFSATAMASSHREAPAIAQDQYADNTDTYVFISPESSDRVVFVANYVPILLGATGPNYYRFADDVLYEIRIDNNGDARPDISYEFKFTTTVTNGSTFLYNVGAITDINDADLNVKQSYTVTQVNLSTGARTLLTGSAPPLTAPWFVGKRTFPAPSEGTSQDAYDAVAEQANIDLGGNRKVFAGPRDEPFFVDLHVFDLLGVAGAPTTDGVNVMSIVLEVPIADVAAGGVRPALTVTDGTALLGVYATASRRQVRILRRGRAADQQGPWVQVSRLGWPLVNEAIIGLADKDKFNRTNPVDDVTNFGSYILMPGLPGLLAAVLELPCPATPTGGRTDLVPLLSGAGSAPGETLTGVTPADLIRIDIRAGDEFSDTGFPNGRALENDVTATALTVLCNAPDGEGGLVVVDDGVTANDKAFLEVFPYLAAPHSGNPEAL